MMISIIVAMDNARAIGKRGGLPWYLPSDLAHFRKVTSGHPIIMGRKTFDSIGRALPNRTNIIITRNPESLGSLASKSENMHVTSNLEEAVGAAKRCDGSDEIFIIGGGEIFKQAIGIADKLYITEVLTEVPGADIFFPEIDKDAWLETARESRKSNENDQYDHNFVIYERKK